MLLPFLVDDASPVSVTFPLDFTTGSLPPGVDASGGVNGSRVNASNVLVNNSAPRFDYTPAGVSRGLLIEPARTRFYGRDAFQFPHSSTGTAVAGPDGVAGGGTLITADNASYNAAVYRFVGDNLGTAVVVLEWVLKYDNCQWMWLRDDYGNQLWCAFDIQNGVIGGAVNTAGLVGYTIEPAGNGYWRCQIAVTPNSNGAGYYAGLQFGNSTTPTNSNITPAGTERVIIANDYVGAYPTSNGSSVRATTTTATARTADAISFTLPSGVTDLRLTYDGGTTQDVTGLTPGTVYTLPTASGRRVTGVADITSGGSGISATFAKTEANDTLASTATLAIEASLAKTEANDTLSATSTLSISATTSSLQEQDTLAATAKLEVRATVGVTELNDTLAATAVIEIHAVVNHTQADDTLSSTATLAINASTNGNEGDDTLSAASTIGVPPITAALTAFEANDALASSATLLVRASATITENNDTLSAASQSTLAATFAGMEGPDTLSAIATISIKASAALVESNDTLAATSVITSDKQATLVRTEADDTLNAAGALLIRAVANISEVNDALLSTSILGVIWDGDGDGGGETFRVPAAASVFAAPAPASTFQVPSARYAFTLSAPPIFVHSAR